VDRTTDALVVERFILDVEDRRRPHDALGVDAGDDVRPLLAFEPGLKPGIRGPVGPTCQHRRAPIVGDRHVQPAHPIGVRDLLVKVIRVLVEEPVFALLVLVELERAGAGRDDLLQVRAVLV
jgi:hypothetical protein